MSVQAPVGISVDQVRRWLSLLHQPDRLADPELVELLELHGRMPSSRTPLAIGEAAAKLLVDTMERLRPAQGGSRDDQRLYDILHLCFVRRATIYQAASRFGLSERQVTRERTRALRLLEAELTNPAPAVPAAASEPAVPLPLESGGDEHYRPEPIPAILDYLPRPAVSAGLAAALAEHRLVHVHGQRGIGKTSLVAETALELGEEVTVFWYHFRPGVNDSLAALLFDLGEHLRARGDPQLAAHVSSGGDVTVGSRVALRSLSVAAHLLVLDDYHHVEADPAISGFVAEAHRRVSNLRAITLERHRNPRPQEGVAFEVPPLTAGETRDLLTHLGVSVERALGDTIQQWTGGVPQLVKLAASWLKTAEPDEVASFTSEISSLDEVQDFLLDSITELISSDDRAILEAASIFRDRFTDHALAYVAERARGNVEDAGRRLVRSYVVTRSRHGDVAFLHATVRDYIRSRLPAAKAARLHRRAGLWYQEQGHDDEARYHLGLAEPQPRD